MLRILVDGKEHFDEEKEEFVILGGFVVELEHSLLALSKWESKFEKPFLGPEEKTSEETLAYIEMMIVSPDPPVGILQKFSWEDFEEINNYINSAQSGTTFREIKQSTGRKQIISAELIYSWMVNYRIPLECETWHLNRLFALLRICNIQNSPPQKKRSAREIAAERRAMNERRKAELGTRG